MITALLWKELLQTLREWRALSLIFLTPVLFSLLMGWAVRRAQRSEPLQNVQTFSLAFSQKMSSNLQPWMDSLHRAFRTIPHPHPREAVASGIVALGLEPGTGETLHVFFRSRDPQSLDALQELQRILERVRQTHLKRFLREAGYRPPVVDHPLAVDPSPGSRRESPWSLQIQRFSTRIVVYLALMFLLMASMQVATDLSIGEKERGTMESFLATGASRAAVVLSKTLVAAAAGMIAAGIVFFNLGGVRLGEVPPPPAWKILAVWGASLPIAVFSALSFLLVGSLSASLKEAQALNGMVLTLYFGAISLASLPLSLPFTPYLPVGSAAHFLNLFMAGFPVGPSLVLTLGLHGLLAGGLFGILVQVYRRGWLWIR